MRRMVPAALGLVLGAGLFATPLPAVATEPPTVAFVGAGHSDAGAQRVKSVRVPAGASVGDTLVMVFTSGTAQSWSGPGGVSGWVRVDSVSGANALVSTVWVRQVTAADLGASVHFDSVTAAKAVLSLADYSGVDPSATVVTKGLAAGVSSTAHQTPVVTAPVGALVVSYWADKSDATTVWSAPGSVVVRDTAIGSGTGRFSALWADAGPVSAGSYGGLVATTDGSSKAVTWTIALSPAGQPPPPPPPPGPVTKLMVVWEENQTSAVLAQMPYLTSLAQTYGSATAYRGVTHPSLGNYLVAASGQGAATCGLTNPLPTACPQPGATVFGQALAAGRTSKTYAESMTANCQQTNSTLYAVRHNPWAYFPDEAADCQRLDVPLGTLASGALRDDVDAGALPDVSMVVPNLQNDLHDGTAAQADGWLQQWLPAVMAGADYEAGRLAIVITFDEGIGSDQTVPFVVISPAATGRTVTADFDHYGLCHLFSDLIDVAPLAGCVSASGLRAAFGL